MNSLCERFSRLSTLRSAPVNYHGLMNQGATSYLNSVLQVLFMTRDFREAVERSMSGDSERIDRQLKDLFDDLKSYTAYTYMITRKLGIDRVNEQQDAAEYFEKILALTSEEASQIFLGELTHKTSCSTCCIEKSTNRTFWHLPLELVKSNSENDCVVDGIKEYFRKSYFSGENQMYCDECDDKSDSTTKYSLKDPPEVLTLLLKRFEFDYNYMSYIKNNCVVDVPFTLHIPESYTYEIYAVVDHCGDLRSGHYTATVKSQDDERWYNFNDTTVTLHDQEPYQADKPNRSCSAYLLFYRKKKNTSTQDVSGDFVPTVGNNDDQCQDGGKKRKIEDDEEPVKVGKERCEDRSDVDDQGVRSRKHEIDERKITDDGDEEEGAGEQVGKRGAFTETQPEESREDQDSRHPGEDRVRLNKPQEGLEAEATHKASDNEQMGEQEVVSMQIGKADLPQINVNMQRDEERKVTQEDKDKTGKSESEQTDKERKTLTKHPKRDEKDEFNEGVDIKDDKQEVREEHVSPYVSVNKKRGEEEMEINKRDDKRGKTRTDRPTSGRGDPIMRPDHYSHGFQIHGEHSASKDDQGCKQRSSSSRSHESQEEEGRRRKGDEGQMDRKAGNDESLLKRSKSESGRQDSDQKNVADVRSNRSEQNVSVRRNKSLSLEKQVKEEKRTGDTHHVQVKPDTSSRQVRSGGSGRLTENQGDDSVERTRAEGFQSKARAEDGNVRGVKERDRSTDDGSKVNTRGGNERKSVALPEGFENISLKDLPSPQDHRSRQTGRMCFYLWKKGKNTFKGSEGVYNTLPSACRTRHINPLGKKCLVKCTLDGVAVEALWDTGAQCTIINETWRAKYLPHTGLKPLTDLSNTGKINLVTATGTPVSIIGWLNIELKLYKGEKETETLTVPTVVANDSCAAVRPIIGFNVIEKSKDAKPWEPES